MPWVSGYRLMGLLGHGYLATGVPSHDPPLIDMSIPLLCLMHVGCLTDRLACYLGVYYLLQTTIVDCFSYS